MKAENSDNKKNTEVSSGMAKITGSLRVVTWNSAVLEIPAGIPRFMPNNSGDFPVGYGVPAVLSGDRSYPRPPVGLPWDRPSLWVANLFFGWRCVFFKTGPLTNRPGSVLGGLPSGNWLIPRLISWCISALYFNGSFFNGPFHQRISMVRCNMRRWYLEAVSSRGQKHRTSLLCPYLSIDRFGCIGGLP